MECLEFQGKKLSDFRVSELRSELDERGLDKAGIKSQLIAKLAKALIDEGSVTVDEKTSRAAKPRIKRRSAYLSGTDGDEKASISVSPDIGGENVPDSSKEEERAPEDIRASRDSETPDDERGDCQEEEEEEEEEDTPEDIDIDEEKGVIDRVTSSAIEEELSQMNQLDFDEEMHQGQESDAISTTVSKSKGKSPQPSSSSTSSKKKAEVEKKGAPGAPDSKRDKNESRSGRHGDKGSGSERIGPMFKKDNVGCSLWVKNITTSTRANDLKTVFSKYGMVVSAKIVASPKQREKHFGYITMQTEEQATNCIQHIHRSELHGRILLVEKVKLDKKKAEPPPRKKSKPDPPRRRKSPDRPKPEVSKRSYRPRSRSRSPVRRFNAPPRSSPSRSSQHRFTRRLSTPPRRFPPPRRQSRSPLRGGGGRFHHQSTFNHRNNSPPSFSRDRRFPDRDSFRHGHSRAQWEDREPSRARALRRTPPGDVRRRRPTSPAPFVRSDDKRVKSGRRSWTPPEERRPRHRSPPNKTARRRSPSPDGRRRPEGRNMEMLEALLRNHSELLEQISKRDSSKGRDFGLDMNTINRLASAAQGLNTDPAAMAALKALQGSQFDNDRRESSRSEPGPPLRNYPGGGGRGGGYSRRQRPEMAGPPMMAPHGGGVAYQQQQASSSSSSQRLPSGGGFPSQRYGAGAGAPQGSAPMADQDRGRPSHHSTFSRGGDGTGMFRK